MKLINKMNEQLNTFELHTERLASRQLYVFIFFFLITAVLKFILIPYNMIDHGEGATRTWNALWWAQNPFFVDPVSGNPGWFYFVGPMLMVIKEIYYFPITLMIIMMSISGIYIFKTSLVLTNFKTSILSFLLFSFNPAIFRLNFTPLPQQIYMTAVCVMIYYFIKAIASKEPANSKRYFLTAGIFAFIGLSFRPEGLVVLLPLCLIALFVKKKGALTYIFLSLFFQIIWSIVSYIIHGSFFKTFEGLREYDILTNSVIQGLNLPLRLKGFFLPYYYTVLGLTFIIFYFFMRGAVTFYKKYPVYVFLIMVILIFIPMLVNGLYGSYSTVYFTTRYFYLTFFYGPLIAAIGLNDFISRLRSSAVQYSAAVIVIISVIPLSYIKELVPYKFNKLFPKVVQFIVTADEPAETRKLIDFIDKFISELPSLIFDASENDSSIFYVPFRSGLAPPDKVLISNYNVPTDKDGLTKNINEFMKRNQKGIIIVRKGDTLMNSIFTRALKENFLAYPLQLRMETEKWLILVYG